MYRLSSQYHPYAAPRFTHPYWLSWLPSSPARSPPSGPPPLQQIPLFPRSSQGVKRGFGRKTNGGWGNRGPGWVVCLDHIGKEGGWGSGEKGYHSRYATEWRVTLARFRTGTHHAAAATTFLLPPSLSPPLSPSPIPTPHYFSHSHLPPPCPPLTPTSTSHLPECSIPDEREDGRR
eukprot:750093-Hanusia_phi.AAC.1